MRPVKSHRARLRPHRSRPCVAETLEHRVLLRMMSEVAVDPVLSISDVRRVEGDAGSTPFIFDVTLSAASAQPVTVTATTAPDTAVPGDYTDVAGLLTFDPGETAKSFTVQVNGETVFEQDETFFVNLTGADGATIGDGQGVGTIVNDDSAGPPLHVTAVFVNGTGWTAPFRAHLAAQRLGSAQFGHAIPAADQLNELPWTNVNQVSIRFDCSASVEQGDLVVRGVRVPEYTFIDFSYDATEYVATWTLDRAIGSDRVLLDLNDSPHGVLGPNSGRLDGEWVNGGDTFPSGDGSPGGYFRFRLNIAPGDINRNGAVSEADLLETRRRYGSYTPTHDVNGDGRVNVLDYALVRRLTFTSLPAGEPTADGAPVAALSASLRSRPPRRDLFSSAPVLG
jgi:hypothetical protein